MAQVIPLFGFSPSDPPSYDESVRDRAVDPAIGDYLDRLIAPLVGTVPYARRERFRQEVLTHLEALAEDYASSGLSCAEAAERAVREHGEPRPIAEGFIAKWFEAGARGPLERRFGRANCDAFGIFVLLQAAYLTLLQVRVFLPYGATYRIPLDGVQVRQLWPSPLLFPDFSPGFLVLAGFPLVAPFFGGWVVGRKVPAGAAKAVYHALTPLILCSFAIGCMLLPVVEGILFALVQLSVWIPVGASVAHVSSLLARASRAGRLTRTHPSP